MLFWACFFLAAFITSVRRYRCKWSIHAWVIVTQVEGEASTRDVTEKERKVGREGEEKERLREREREEGDGR